MTIDIAKARALAKRCADLASIADAYSEEDYRDAADTIAALLDEVERLNSPVVLSEWQKLVAERDALARDAARYRWLRQPNPLHREAHIAVLTHNGGWVASGERADAAIDAAMKGAGDE